MSAKSMATPSRTLLPSPIERTPPSTTKKRILNDISINIPPRPHSAQDFTTPEHPNQHKKFRKVSEPLSAPLSAAHPQKRESSTEDSVWGPEIEAAFMCAIRTIPKLGRRKICIGSKPCGRNELIAAFIQRRTGKIRTRKQVSSHIQVLKHIRRDDAEFLALVADGKEGDYDDGVSPKFAGNEMDFLGSADQPSSLEQDYQISIPLGDEHSPLGSNLRSRSHSLVQPQSMFHVEEFCVWATNRDRKTDTSTVSHVYTTFEREMATAVAPLDAVSDWALRYPCLPKLISDSLGVQCPIFHLRAGLNLPDSLDFGGEFDVILETQLALMCNAPPRTRDQWICTTRVYTIGNKVLELQQKTRLDQVNRVEPIDGLKSQPGMKLNVPFATDFWATFLASLASLEPNQQGLGQAERAAKRSQDSRNAVAGITIVQELTTMENSSELPQRLCVLLWEFNQIPHGQDGQTFVMQVAPPEPISNFMKVPSMGRSASAQPNSSGKKKNSRPQLNLQHGHGLQRSQSVAAVPSHSSYQHAATTARAPLQRQTSMPYLPHTQNQVVPPPPVCYEPIFDHSQLIARPMPVTNPQVMAYPVPPAQTPATSHAMARSFSAPTWTHNSMPTSYPVVDLNAWNDSFLDWNIPESAGYLHSDFQVSSDELCSGTTPSRPQSIAPVQSYGMEHTTSTTGTDIEDDAMPRLGFFPLAHY